MFSPSNYTCKFEHLKIVTYHLVSKVALSVGEVAKFEAHLVSKVALSVGEVAKFEASKVASLE
jgi:hypothetical protein